MTNSNKNYLEIGERARDELLEADIVIIHYEVLVKLTKLDTLILFI